MSNFDDTFKAIWATRPPRIPKAQGGNAMFGGVCEGLGARYRIDPVLFRIFFVVTFFAWGGSLLAYLLLMLVMPRYGMAKAPWDCVSAPKHTLTVEETKDRSTGYVLLVFIVLFAVGAINVSMAEASSLTSLLTVAAIGAAIYFLHKRTPQPPEGLLAQVVVDKHTTLDDDHTTADATTTAANTAGFTQDFSRLTPVDGYPHPDVGRTTPPAWDPLGTVPELWDLPDPTQPQPEPPKKNRSGWAWAVGLGAIVAAIAVTTGVAYNAVSGSDSEGNDYPLGYQQITVSTEEELAQVGNATDGETRKITHGAGDVVLDLTDLPALEKDHHVLIVSRVGNVTIVPSHEARMDVTCFSRLGTAECGDESAVSDSEGSTANSRGVINPEAEGGTLTINVHQFIGGVQTVGPGEVPTPETSGSRTVVMTREDQLADVDFDMGELTVDMRNLAPLDEDHEITINADMGIVFIDAPENVPTVFDCYIDMGEENCPEALNTDADGGELTVRVNHNMGEVVVR